MIEDVRDAGQHGGVAGESAGVEVDYQRMVSRVMRGVPDIVACGMVNLRDGSWVALESVGRHPEDFLSYLAMQARALFEGDAVHTIQTVLQGASGDPRAGGGIGEIVMRTAGTVHVLVRWEPDPTLVLAVVTKRGTRLGLILATLRDAVGMDVASGL